MKAILVDFDTEKGRDPTDNEPIGVLLERGERAGFDSFYTEAVTEEQDSGHDNYVRMMLAVESFRDAWDKGGDDPGVSVVELFTYLVDNSYLGLRFRTLGKVDDSVTIGEAYKRFVENGEPLPVLSDEEFPSGI